MRTDGSAPVDVVLEAPASVGLLVAWADEQQDQQTLQLVGHALNAARAAGLQRLQEEGGWCARGRAFARDDLVLQVYRHYLAGEHVDLPRPHEHLYVDPRTRCGDPVHRDVLPTAALQAQLSYGRAMARALDDGGFDVVVDPTRTPARWELSAVAEHASRLPRHVCTPNVPVAEQIVPINRWADPRAA